MIKITIKKKDGLINFINSSGHAVKNNGYSGSCLGVSLLLKTWLKVLLNDNKNMSLKLEDGFLECVLIDCSIDNVDNFLLLGLKELKLEFGSDINLVISEE